MDTKFSKTTLILLVVIGILIGIIGRLLVADYKKGKNDISNTSESEQRLNGNTKDIEKDMPLDVQNVDEKYDSDEFGHYYFDENNQLVYVDGVGKEMQDEGYTGDPYKYVSKDVYASDYFEGENVYTPGESIETDDFNIRYITFGSFMGLHEYGVEDRLCYICLDITYEGEEMSYIDYDSFYFADKEGYTIGKLAEYKPDAVPYDLPYLIGESLRQGQRIKGMIIGEIPDYFDRVEEGFYLVFENYKFYIQTMTNPSYGEPLHSGVWQSDIYNESHIGYSSNNYGCKILDMLDEMERDEDGDLVAGYELSSFGEDYNWTIIYDEESSNHYFVYNQNMSLIGEYFYNTSSGNLLYKDLVLERDYNYYLFEDGDLDIN